VSPVEGVGWGIVSLLYLLACALQYRYLNNTCAFKNQPVQWLHMRLPKTSRVTFIIMPPIKPKKCELVASDDHTACNIRATAAL
jgi:hypothetical protein